VQRADHAQAERPLAREHLGDAGATADEGLQIILREPLLVHAEADSVNGIGKADGRSFS
jgi:hypothetical protein